MAIGDLIKSTLGPKGMDKILQSASGSGAITVTNDGATILGSIVVDNPAAKVLINISKTQDDEVGDGTTRYGGGRRFASWNFPDCAGGLCAAPPFLRRRAYAD